MKTYTDNSGHIVYFNSQYISLTGIDVDSVLDKSIYLLGAHGFPVSKMMITFDKANTIRLLACAAIIVLFWIAPPVATITSVGMKVIGVSAALAMGSNGAISIPGLCMVATMCGFNVFS